MYSNKIARTLWIIGISHMIAGVIMGIISITANVYYAGAGLTNFLMWALGGFIIGMLFVGFAENISLLQQIKEQLGIRNTEKSPKYFARAENSFITEDIDDGTQEKIYAYYDDSTILNIISSPKENYYLVRLSYDDDEYVKVVYVDETGVEETMDNTAKREIIQWYNQTYG